MNKTTIVTTLAALALLAIAGPAMAGDITDPVPTCEFDGSLDPDGGFSYTVTQDGVRGRQYVVGFHVTCA